jgi:flagellin-like protein
MKILKSRKALSPVVASIILIAVTVAVSIAVAAWMGALTLGFTKTENIVLPEAASITWHNTTSNSGDYIQIPIKNSQTALVTVITVKINGDSTVTTDPPVSFSLSANQQKTIKITFAWNAGSKYRIDFITSNNNDFFQEYTAPSP